LILLGLFALTSRRGGTETFRTTALALSVGDQPAVQVTWQRPREVSTEDLVQYQVIRSSAQDGECVVAVIPGDRRIFIDTVSSDPDARNLGDIVQRSQGGTTTGGTTTGGTTTGGAIAGTSLSGAIVRAQQVACPDTVLPIVPGRVYTYLVEAVFVPPIDIGGGTTTGGTTTGGTTPTLVVSTPGNASNRVTALGLATPVAPADGATGVDLNAVVFQFTTGAGPTEYVVQVSTDGSFQQGSTFEVARLFNGDQQASDTLTTQPLNLTSRFAGRAQLFWRVGGRNTLDSVQPVNSYVFSTARVFQPAAA
jgi:hypothetical protein